MRNLKKKELTVRLEYSLKGLGKLLLSVTYAKRTVVLLGHVGLEANDVKKVGNLTECQSLPNLRSSCRFWSCGQSGDHPKLAAV